jgi:hypothetical protein
MYLQRVFLCLVEFVSALSGHADGFVVEKNLNSIVSRAVFLLLTFHYET